MKFRRPPVDLIPRDPNDPYTDPLFDTDNLHFTVTRTVRLRFGAGMMLGLLVAGGVGVLMSRHPGAAITTTRANSEMGLDNLPLPDEDTATTAVDEVPVTTETTEPLTTTTTSSATTSTAPHARATACPASQTLHLDPTGLYCAPTAPSSSTTVVATVPTTIGQPAVEMRGTQPTETTMTTDATDAETTSSTTTEPGWVWRSQITGHEITVQLVQQGMGSKPRYGKVTMRLSDGSTEDVYLDTSRNVAWHFGGGPAIVGVDGAETFDDTPPANATVIS